MLKRERVYNELAELIRSGKWAPGFKLPAEPLLCRRLGVGRVTLRAALERLSGEGLLFRSRPGGSIVTAPESERQTILVVSAERNVPDSPKVELYILPGIERRCLELNITVEYMTDALLPEHLPENRNWLGIIVLMMNFSGGEAVLGKLRKLSLPVVCAHGFPGDPAVTDLPTITTDFHAAFRAGLTHLVRMGHKKICFLLKDWGMVERRMRLTEESFSRLLEEAGLDAARQKVIQTDSPPNDFSGKLREILFGAEPPTAIYAYSDYFALRCCALLREWRIRIPEQAAVLGFSGSSAAALQSPPLSTVDFGYTRIGAMAVDMLRRHDEWPREKVPVIFSPFDVIPRKSTDFCRLDFPARSDSGEDIEKNKRAQYDPKNQENSI